MNRTLPPKATGPNPATPAGRRILSVASELFYTHGINAVGMELVAERAEVTKKTVYDRYGSKDGLVAAYLRARDERWRAWMDERLAASTSPSDAVLASYQALESWMAAESPRGCAFVNAAAELPDREHPGRQVVVEQKRWLRQLYARLAEAAGVSELADAFFMLHEGVLVARDVADVQNAAELARAAAARLLTSAERPSG